MLPQDAFRYVQRHVVLFERTRDNPPSGDEQKRLSADSKWSVFGYIRLGEDTLVSCASRKEEEPTQDQRNRAAQVVMLNLMNLLGKTEPAPEKPQIFVPGG